MSKLFAVTVEYTVMVYAEHSGHAEAIAENSLRDIAQNECPNVYAWNPDVGMERRWAGSLPYGDHQERTVREILARPEPRDETKEGTP